MDNAQPATSTNIATELARERTRAAADRTLMAWVGRFIPHRLRLRHRRIPRDAAVSRVIRRRRKN